MKKLQRLTAAALAAVLVASNVVVALAASKAATPRASTADVVLSYLRSDEDDPSVATILVGNSTTIKISKPSGLTEAKPPFIVKKANDSTNTDMSDYVQIKDNLLGGTKDVTVLESYVDDGEMPADGMETFSITGSYYALLAEGSAYETAPDGSGYLNTIKSETKGAVTLYSEVTIVCDKPETEGEAPHFVIKDDAKITGLFADYKTGGQIWVEDFEQTSSTNKTLPASKTLTLKFENGAGGGETLFTLTSKQKNIIYKEQEDPNNPDQTIQVEESRNNYIQEGTEFRLVFNLPTSNTLMLNVLTPQRAVQNIADEIYRNDGVVTDSYIDLSGDPDEEGHDTLNFVTENFRLNSQSDQYSANFDIEWFWYSEDAEADVVEGLTTEGGKVEITDDPHAGVVSIANSGTWRQVEIHPEKSDVRGYLVAKIYYKKNIFSEEVVCVSQPKFILIRGVGEPASALQYSQTIGQSEPELFTVDEQALPTTKTMDVYDGSVPNYAAPKDPYRYRLRLNMGRLNASSQYAIVTATSGDSSVVGLQQVYNEVAEDYQLGDQIENPKKVDTDSMATVYLDIIALKKGSVTLQITFYVKGNNGTVVPAAVQPKPITITVTDTSPSDDAALSELTLKDQNKQVIDYGFDPEVVSYTVSVPYSTTEITVTPRRRDSLAAQYMVLEVLDQNNQQVSYNERHENGYISEQIHLEPNQVTTIKVTETAQNPNVTRTYTLQVVREPPSDDSSLKVLQFYDTTGAELLQGFDPTVMTYEITVPYKTDIVRVEAVPNHAGAHAPSFDPPLQTQTDSGFGAKEWLPLIYDNGAEPGHTFQNRTTLGISILPENGVVYDSSIYKVTFTRQDPGKIATLDSLLVTDSLDQGITYTPQFDMATDTYEVSIPFVTEKLKLQATPTDPNATMALYDGEKLLQEMKADTPTKAFEVPFITESEPYHTYTIRVTAEDGLTVLEYYLQVSRAQPSNDATLKDLQMFDQDSAPIKTFAFNPEVTSYAVEVEYETRKVSFTPTTNYAVESILVNGRRVQSGNQSSLIELKYPETTRVEIVVTAQDGQTKMTYTVDVIRKPPSSDARLRDLVVSDTTDFYPVFMAGKTSYTANVAEGAKTVTVTPTANHKYATIKVDGVLVNSGETSEPIYILEVKQDITIEVTAQDGATVMTYVVHLTNNNLVPKSDNADLSSLKVERGVMTPKFAPSTTQYEVTTTEETYSVEILPTPADSGAKVEVYAGTREIGDKNGNFSEAIQDGANEFTVRVTSSDETTVKEYDITVYRNEEDQLKTLKPLTAADLDIENSPNPIIVDITKYPRIAADVFTELKKYPEKSIIFQGNDYSLQFDADNLNKVIPSTEIYDFRMSFTSPEEEEIMDIVYERSANDDIYSRGITLLYFEHHGELPGPAILNLNLGDRYASRNLYWHYYNAERERIDYYGRVYTNNKGTFAVQIDHFSTYIISRRHRIAGSELMYAGNDLNENIGVTGSGNKVNPNTGEDGNEGKA